VLGAGQGDWAAAGIALTRVDATHWRTTLNSPVVRAGRPPSAPGR